MRAALMLRSHQMSHRRRRPARAIKICATIFFFLFAFDHTHTNTRARSFFGKAKKRWRHVNIFLFSHFAVRERMKQRIAGNSRYRVPLALHHIPREWIFWFEISKKSVYSVIHEGSSKFRVYVEGHRGITYQSIDETAFWNCFQIVFWSTINKFDKGRVAQKHRGRKRFGTIAD